MNLPSSKIPPKPGFGWGLVLGSLAGMAGYFLYGTSEGKRFKDEFHARYQAYLEQAKLHPARKPVNTNLARSGSKSTNPKKKRLTFHKSR